MKEVSKPPKLKKTESIDRKGTCGIITSIISAVHSQPGHGKRTGPDVSSDIFWAAIRAYLEYFPTHADAGIDAYFWTAPIGPDGSRFKRTRFLRSNIPWLSSRLMVHPVRPAVIPYPGARYHDTFLDACAASGLSFQAMEETNISPFTIISTPSRNRVSRLPVVAYEL